MVCRQNGTGDGSLATMPNALILIRSERLGYGSEVLA